jgi:hypothetical protein
MGLGLREAAQQLGINHSTLLRRVKTGAVTREPDGTFDVEKCRAQLAANTNLGKQANAKARKPKHATPSKDEPEASGEPEDQPPPETSEGDYAEACRQEKWEAVRKKRLERRKREGELLELTEVRQAWGEMVSSARAQLLLLPAKLAPQIAFLSDVRECQAVIDTEIRSLLTVLSEYRPAVNS